MSNAGSTPGENGSQPELFIDNERYDWEATTITGAQIRVLGAVPENALIFQKIPGQKDKPILDDTVVDLSEIKGPDRFSTQSPDSEAG